MRSVSFSLLFILLLLGCSDDHRYRVVGDQLTVYHSHLEDQHFAEEVAKFWKSNHLLTGQKQDLQLIRDSAGMHLSMIAHDPKDLPNMTFNERRILLQLEDSLQSNVFKNETLFLEVTNDNFERIYDVN